VHKEQRAQHQDDQAAGIITLLLLATGAAALVWFTLSKARRFEVEFVVTNANPKAGIISASVLATFVLLLALAARRRSRFLTSAVESAHGDFLGPKGWRTRLLALAPLLVVTVVGWAIYAVGYGAGDFRWLWIGFLRNREFAFVRGALTLTNTVGVALALPLAAMVVLNATGLTKAWRAAVVASRVVQAGRKRLPPPGDYQANGTAPTFLLGARESSECRAYDPKATVPSWVTWEPPAVFGGLLLIGKKGSGKTSLLLRMADDAIRFKPNDAELKCAVVVVDQKGDIADWVEAKAKEYGRQEDVVRLGVGTTAHWNPFATLGVKSTALECRQVGYFMRSAMTPAGQYSGDNTFWADNADNLIFRSIHLLALAGERVGFAEVYRLITAASAEEHWSSELMLTAEMRLNNRETAGEDVKDQRDELLDTERYFESDFAKLDPKVRTTIISVVSNFHQKFMTAEYQRSFGSAATDPGHFGGFRDLIARGGIFVLDVRTNEHGTVAGALAMLVKLFYQAAVKTRDRNPADSMRRATLYLMDEAQACVTPSGPNTEGDDKYLEMSRSFRAIDVYATQQYTSFEAAVGRPMAQRILGSFNSLITFRHNDPSLTEHIQKLLGNEERAERSVTVSESASAAERNLLASEGETERDRQVSRSVALHRRERHRIEAAAFQRLTTFEALGFFDSPRGMTVTQFCTKPHFVDARLGHEEVLRRVEEQR
jgi:hypothetical protein